MDISYSELFKAMLQKLNFNKSDKFLRHVEEHKLLSFMPKKEMYEVLTNPEKQKLWELLASMSYTGIKSTVCERYDLATIFANSCRYQEKLSPRDWFYLEFLKQTNSKKFLSVITSEKDFTLNPQEGYKAETQGLPDNLIKLNHSYLVTPLNDYFLQEASEILSLCTFENRFNIGPKHQKMLVFNQDKKLIAILTVYAGLNCFALSGKGNTSVSEKIEEEIVMYGITQGMWNKQAYAIRTESEFRVINENFKAGYSLESNIKHYPKLMEQIFPDAVEVIKARAEKKKLDEEEYQRKQKAKQTERKALLLSKISDPKTIQIIQERLIKKVENSKGDFELSKLEEIIKLLSEESTPEDDNIGIQNFIPFNFIK